ncbi:DUF2255 family protein [Cryptosporangium sp. NPDC048952]|uniref:DUF2255 family protein n=1 Tax=Cryptosporangium sp. NPDC048952 TaxID=3363961 RepID=UPI003716BE73
MHAEWTSTEAAILSATPTMRVIAGVDPPMSVTGRRGAEVGMVVVDGRLYVRGRNATWVRWAVAQRRGWIRTGTIDRAVTFARYDGPPDAIDAAYSAKYGNPNTQEITLRVEPID